jgi:uncharacterized protein (DUF2384 family)
MNMQDVERVVSAAEAVSGDRIKALEWLTQPLDSFAHKTPQQLIAEGRTDVVLSYIESIASGFVG